MSAALCDNCSLFGSGEGHYIGFLNRAYQVVCVHGQNYKKNKAEGDVGDVLFEFYAEGVRCV